MAPNPTKQPAPTRTGSILSECEALKRKIRRERPVKTSRFSLSHMKRVAIPPVEIPLSFTNAPTFVAGKRVLFTRESFAQRKYERRLLRRIREDEMLRL
ncbi:hypothetical protein PybrP1_009044 [[Pythium] brassicae (nom. inval.)]|nr:hypothetical protein PybrP1_009044 [[Pythium] brassicae (nom. inval.)]